MEVRISFRAEVYVKGDTIEEIKTKFESLPLFSADALEEYGAEYIETQSVERVDDESYEDVYHLFK